VTKDISMTQEAKAAILSLPAEQSCRITHPQRIYVKIGSSSPIPRIHLLEDTGGPFFLDPEGTRPDPIEDDMALWFESDRGLVIITGCCHSGLINTVSHIRQIKELRLPKKKELR
jgi:7,8-dihydropterin-6-yl-methyl-4-(beta-D-ribofuranosyl)aminobenzene 5'-phosphate synthase